MFFSLSFLVEFHKLGVECVYNNKQLVGWADVAFLCCLPCHIPHICSEIQGSLKNSCIIYSLVTAIPLTRYCALLYHLLLLLETKKYHAPSPDVYS